MNKTRTERPYWLGALGMFVAAAVITMMPLVVTRIVPHARGAMRGAALSADVAATLPAGALGEAVRAADLSVLLANAPAQPIVGVNQLDALILDSAGQPLNNAKVTFDLDMTNMSHGPYIVDAQASGSGHYSGRVNYSMGGPWRVHVTVEPADRAQAKVRFTFRVNGP